MDRQRHALAAYEYLCHVGEAQQWIEGCLQENTKLAVTEIEEGLRDGVVLASLARHFQGDAVVKRIWTVGFSLKIKHLTSITGRAGQQASVQANG